MTHNPTAYTIIDQYLKQVIPDLSAIVNQKHGKTGILLGALA
jgi:hypothetical protein